MAKTLAVIAAEAATQERQGPGMATYCNTHYDEVARPEAGNAPSWIPACVGMTKGVA